MSKSQIVVEVKLKGTSALIEGQTQGNHYDMADVKDIIELGRPLSIYTEGKLTTLIQDWNKVANIKLKWADNISVVVYDINIV